MIRKFVLLALLLPMMLLAGEKELIPNPCKLLEKAELEKIVQVPLDTAVGGETVCLSQK